MAKSELKIRARKLRKEGNSIKDIAKKLLLPKSTVSDWCSDIELTPRQLQLLMQRKQNVIRQGQINGALVNKRKRLAVVSEFIIEGKKRFEDISEKEFFTAGLALYLAEGSKKQRSVEFTNSDPIVLAFMYRWFRKFLDVQLSAFQIRVYINQIHKERETSVRNYWAHYLKIPQNQISRTCFVKSKQHKVYENYNEHYGTIKLRVLKSSHLFYKIMGLINAMLEAGLKKLPV